jgi:hypothetical protein
MPIIENLSFLISLLTFGGLSLLFADSLLLRFEWQTLLKSLGFGLLGVGSLLNLTSSVSYTPMIIWLYAAALFCLLIAMTNDPNTKSWWLLLPAIIVTLFRQDHFLLFALSFLVSLAVFRIVHVTKHTDLIALGVGLLLVSVGEYFYSLESTQSLTQLAAAGSFLYLFAALALIYWLWSYLAVRLIALWRSDAKFLRSSK